MNSISAMPPVGNERNRRLSIGFLNWAHALDHFVILIFPTVVIGLEIVYARPYGELIALSTASFVAFGVFSLPAGWLADRWSRRNMMGAFYIGCGLSLAGAALAPNLIMLAVALFALGAFAAIYHPVGMAMLIDLSRARGRTLAFNGVCGNVGAALAAGITAALASWLGWRAAFVIPGVVCVATGFAFLVIVPDDRHRAGTRQSEADVSFSARVVLMMFALYVVISICGGLTFNTVAIALPKLVDERLGGNVTLLAVGGLTTAVFLCGALAQAIPRPLLGGECHRHDAGRCARAYHGGDLRPGHGWRHRDRPLYRRRMARPHLCGALFPHLRVVRCRRVRHRFPAQPGWI